MKKVIIFAEPGTLVSDGLVPTAIKQANKVENIEIEAVVDVSNTNKPPSLMSEFKRQMDPKEIGERILRRIKGLPTQNYINCRTKLSNQSSPVRFIDETEPNSERFIKQLQKISPDAILLLGCSKILCKKILDVPTLDVINYHWSYLPEYRGRHVTYWAAYNGENHHGVTFHTINEEIDQGEIILRERVPVRHGGRTLAEDCLSKGRRLLKKLMNQLSLGSLQKREAIIGGEYYPVPKFNSHNQEIDFSIGAEENVRRIRASEGLKGKIDDRMLYITRAESIDVDSDEKNGHLITISKKGVDISTEDGILRVTEIYYLPAWIVAKTLGISE